MAERLTPAGIADARGLAADGLAARLDGLDLAPLLVYRLEAVPDDALPLLGWQFHVMGDEGWSFADTPAARRELIRRAIELHRYKGTPWAVRRAAETAGFRVLRIVEGIPLARYDAAYSHDGTVTYGDPLRWAEFRVDLELGERGLAAADVGRVTRLVEAYKNTRSHLESVAFAVALADDAPAPGETLGHTLAYEDAEPFAPVRRYDGVATYDGAATYDGGDGAVREELTVDVVAV